MQWEFDGTNIAGATDTTLAVSNVSPANAGIYSVTLSNAFGATISSNAALTISLVQNGGFEDGNLTGWTESTNNEYISVNSDYVYSGAYGLEAGPVGSLGYISQSILTVPAQAYLLSFWLDSPDGDTPNEFQVGWDGDTLFDQVNMPETGWTNMQFIVVATGTTSVLEFGFQNDPGYFGLDNVTLTPVTGPTVWISVVSYSTNGAFQLAVYGQTGQSYTLQASTNLVDWVSLSSFTYTNTPTYVSDPAAGNYSRRFYRVAQRPLLPLYGDATGAAFTSGSCGLTVNSTVRLCWMAKVKSAACAASGMSRKQ
jgi:hypothetical protein